jgi:nitroimidazol reductase NimA-like FMN-containing flavoprotein (pyridoxamine 5'-phosphate oxidase superfamily)
MIVKLGVEEAREMLRESRIAHLGCIAEGAPYVIPVHYFYDGVCVYIHSLPGRKITAMRENPRVCLQVEKIQDEFHWRSVIAFGEYEEVEDLEERDRVLQELFARFPHFTPVESAMAEAAGVPPTIVFRLRIHTITGVSES